MHLMATGSVQLSKFLAFLLLCIQVLQEYDILKSLPSDLPIPRALYASSASDEAVVKRAFIIVEFVPVCTWCVVYTYMKSPACIYIICMQESHVGNGRLHNMPITP